MHHWAGTFGPRLRRRLAWTRKRPAHLRIIPFLVLVAGLTAMHYPILLSGFWLTQHDLVDSRLNNYLLEHGYQWLIGNPSHRAFWNAPFFFPVPNTMAYSETMLSAQPLYWGWRVLGLLPDTAFQLWILTASILNFLVSYGCLRKCLKVRPLGASLGAFLFAFGGPRMLHVPHQQLLPHFFSMVALCAVSEVFHQKTASPARQRSWLAVLAASVVAQLYSSFYLGWFLLLGLAISTAASLIHHPYRRVLLATLGRHKATVAASIVVGGALLIPMAQHYLEAATTIGYRPLCVSCVMRPLEWLDQSSRSLLYGALASPDLHFEKRVGCGFLTVGLALFGLWHNRARPLPAIALLTIAVLWITFTNFFGDAGTDAPLLWAYLRQIPGGGAIRAPARVALVMLVPLAIGLALTIDGMARKRWWLAALVALGCMAEQPRSSDNYEKVPTRRRVQTLATRIGPGCPAFYYSPPWFADGYFDAVAQVDAMWAGLATGVPTVNGYSGGSPPEWGPLTAPSARSPDDLPRLRAALNHWRNANGLAEADVCWITPAQLRWSTNASP